MAFLKVNWHFWKKTVNKTSWGFVYIDQQPWVGEADWQLNNFILKNVEEFWHISNLNDHVIRIQDFRPHHGVPVSISKNAKSR